MTGPRMAGGIALLALFFCPFVSANISILCETCSRDVLQNGALLATYHVDVLKASYVGDGQFETWNHDERSQGSVSVSFDLPATVDSIVVQVDMAVSSEANYDLMWVEHMDMRGLMLERLGGISGEEAETHFFTMANGDALRMRYVKDGSVNHLDDRGLVRFAIVADSVGTVHDCHFPEQSGFSTGSNMVECANCVTDFRDCSGERMLTLVVGGSSMQYGAIAVKQEEVVEIDVVLDGFLQFTRLDITYSATQGVVRFCKESTNGTSIQEGVLHAGMSSSVDIGVVDGDRLIFTYETEDMSEDGVDGSISITVPAAVTGSGPFTYGDMDAQVVTWGESLRVVRDWFGNSVAAVRVTMDNFMYNGYLSFVSTGHEPYDRSVLRLHFFTPVTVAHLDVALDWSVSSSPTDFAHWRHERVPRLNSTYEYENFVGCSTFESGDVDRLDHIVFSNDEALIVSYEKDGAHSSGMDAVRASVIIGLLQASDQSEEASSSSSMVASEEHGGTGLTDEQLAGIFVGCLAGASLMGVFVYGVRSGRLGKGSYGRRRAVPSERAVVDEAVSNTAEGRVKRPSVMVAWTDEGDGCKDVEVSPMTPEPGSATKRVAHSPAKRRASSPVTPLAWGPDGNVDDIERTGPYPHGNDDPEEARRTSTYTSVFRGSRAEDPIKHVTRPLVVGPREPRMGAPYPIVPGAGMEHSPKGVPGSRALPVRGDRSVVYICKDDTDKSMDTGMNCVGASRVKK